MDDYWDDAKWETYTYLPTLNQEETDSVHDILQTFKVNRVRFPERIKQHLSLYREKYGITLKYKRLLCKCNLQIKQLFM